MGPEKFIHTELYSNVASTECECDVLCGRRQLFLFWRNPFPFPRAIPLPRWRYLIPQRRSTSIPPLFSIVPRRSSKLGHRQSYIGWGSDWNERDEYTIPDKEAQIQRLHRPRDAETRHFIHPTHPFDPDNTIWVISPSLILKVIPEYTHTHTLLHCQLDSFKRKKYACKTLLSQHLNKNIQQKERKTTKLKKKC